MSNSYSVLTKVPEIQIKKDHEVGLWGKGPASYMGLQLLSFTICPSFDPDQSQGYEGL